MRRSCAWFFRLIGSPLIRLYSDVLGKQSSIDVFVYDRSHETFLGHARVDVNVTDHNAKHEGWYRLEKRNAEDDTVTGEIYLGFSFQKTDKKAYGPEDFQITRLIGKGTLCVSHTFSNR